MKVAVSGAAGRMGRSVTQAVLDAADLTLSGLFAPGHGGEAVAGQALSDDPSCAADADVVVEVTRPDVVLANIEQWRGMSKHVVVGTSGFDEVRLDAVRRIWGTSEKACLVVPNFSIGAVLMMRFAEMAAPHFAAAEIVELHHDRKVDAPSGTAASTASRIGSAAPHQHRRVESTESVDGVRGGTVGGIPVHSVRLPGLLAHQEVLLGNDGEVLTIRHDSTDRISFMPGVLLAIRSIHSVSGVSVGLDDLI